MVCYGAVWSGFDTDLTIKTAEYGRFVTPYRDSYRKAKNNFKKDFGGPGGEDPMVAKQKLHDAKKKAIKETCLSILSVIDEL